jgi:hypothetical protein
MECAMNIHCRGPIARRLDRHFGQVVHAFSITLLVVATSVHAAQRHINGPVGSAFFGGTVLALPNGNIAVSDSGFGGGKGAVYLYRSNGELISTLTGVGLDAIGNGGLVRVGSTHFVVQSPNFDNGVVANVGAATWVDGNIGLNGVVSSSNSLIGTHANDSVSQYGIVVLSNGNYVVVSSPWDNGDAVDAGAVTWGNGELGVRGTVSPSNSLVGTSNGDFIGYSGVAVLTNGNYVVCSADWNNGAATHAGAATFGNGNSGAIGAVSAANSLVGTQTDDQVAFGCATALSNGHYVVASPFLGFGITPKAGAATWGNGTGGTVGPIFGDNSLIGTHAEDRVGADGIVALTNGHYVVISKLWDNNATPNVGAVTWGNGNGGTTGAVSASNSLIGVIDDDRAGNSGVTALTNGNYVVASNLWNNGALSNPGAVTWCSGTGGCNGLISAANSLIGTQASDNIGDGGVVALRNGHYAVVSFLWNNGGVVAAGAVTWGNGVAGTIGSISTGNSLVGTQTSDLVGLGGVIALSNGNYLVRSPNWNRGAIADAGAVTWRPGNAANPDTVTDVNSLVGVTSMSFSGSTVAPLVVDHALVAMPNEHGDQAGAVVGINGNGAFPTGVVPVSAMTLRSLSAGDQIGSEGLYVVSQEYYVVLSPHWSADRGAVSMCRLPALGTQTLNVGNSVFGTVPGGGNNMGFDFDPARKILVVGQPAANRVTVFDPDTMLADGFEGTAGI